MKSDLNQQNICFSRLKKCEQDGTMWLLNCSLIFSSKGRIDNVVGDVLDKNSFNGNIMIVPIINLSFSSGKN